MKKNAATIWLPPAGSDEEPYLEFCILNPPNYASVVEKINELLNNENITDKEYAKLTKMAVNMADEGMINDW